MTRHLCQKLLVAAFAAGPAPVLAQSVCIAPEPSSVPPCVVGTWEAASDMSEKMQAILDMIPTDMRTNFKAQVDPSLGKNLFIAIYSDGFYATTHIYGEIEGRFFSDQGATPFTMSIMTTPASGWMSFSDGTLGFCTNDWTGASTTVTEGSSELASPDTGPRETWIDEMGPETVDTRFGPSPLAADVSYSCAGGTMQMQVVLPDPIGVVTYDLRKIAPGMLSESLREVYDRRFGFY